MLPELEDQVVAGRIERRLAAILAADAAGYSGLMEADEEGTLVSLLSIPSTTLKTPRPMSIAPGGSLPDNDGDGTVGRSFPGGRRRVVPV
jgi:hypothetical protein